MSRSGVIGVCVLASMVANMSDALGSTFCPPNGPGAPTYCENIPYLGKPNTSDRPGSPVPSDHAAAQPSATSDLIRYDRPHLPEKAPVAPSGRGIGGNNPQ